MECREELGRVYAVVRRCTPLVPRKLASLPLAIRAARAAPPPLPAIDRNHEWPDLAGTTRMSCAGEAPSRDGVLPRTSRTRFPRSALAVPSARCDKRLP